jgi:hypothetical protein
VVGREIWFKYLRRTGWHMLAPSTTDTFTSWWLRARKQVSKLRRAAFDSYIILLAWCIWWERNNRAFDGCGSPPVVVADLVFLLRSIPSVRRDYVPGRSYWACNLLLSVWWRPVLGMWCTLPSYLNTKHVIARAWKKVNNWVSLFVLISRKSFTVHNKSESKVNLTLHVYWYAVSYGLQYEGNTQMTTIKRQRFEHWYSHTK